jgi:hypothetical protein
MVPPDLAEEVLRSMTDLRRTRLAATAWPVVAGDLGRLDAAVDHRDEDAIRAALLPISQAAFEGKVRGRLAGADRTAAFVSVTKKTSALPAVGLVCGGILLLLGYLLGGWLVFLGTAVFALFIFGVAVAGTRTNLDRTEERRARGQAPTRESTEFAPPVVVQAIAGIERALT